MKTFEHFCRSPDGFVKRVPWSGDFAQEILARLHTNNIKSLNGLYSWCRQRYPDFYKEYRFLSDGSGKEKMAELWSYYLAWAEGAK